MEKKKFGQTKVGKVVKKIVTAPVRMVKKAVAKERAYNDYKAKKFQEELMRDL